MKQLIFMPLLVFSNTIWAKEKVGKTNLLYFNPVQSAVATHYQDVTTLTFGYEKFLSAYNIAVNCPVSLGYEEKDGLTSYSFGTGLVLKKYLLNQMQGGYPFILVQGLYSQSKFVEYYNGPKSSFGETTVYDAGAGYGYLWVWKQIILDWNLGARMEFMDNNTEFKLLGNVSLGFPF